MRCSAGLGACRVLCSHLAAVRQSRTVADWVYSSNRCPRRTFHFSPLLLELLCNNVQCDSGYCLLSVGEGVNTSPLPSSYQYNFCSSCHLPFWCQTKRQRGGRCSAVYEKRLIDMWAAATDCLLFTLTNVSADDEWCKQWGPVCVWWTPGAAGRPHRGYYQRNLPARVRSLQKHQQQQQKTEPTFTVQTSNVIAFNALLDNQSLIRVSCRFWFAETMWGKKGGCWS